MQRTNFPLGINKVYSTQQTKKSIKKKFILVR